MAGRRGTGGNLRLRRRGIRVPFEQRVGRGKQQLAEPVERWRAAAASTGRSRRKATKEGDIWHGSGGRQLVEPVWKTDTGKGPPLPPVWEWRRKIGKAAAVLTPRHGAWCTEAPTRLANLGTSRCEQDSRTGEGAILLEGLAPRRGGLLQELQEVRRTEPTSEEGQGTTANKPRRVPHGEGSSGRTRSAPNNG